MPILSSRRGVDPQRRYEVIPRQKLVLESFIATLLDTFIRCFEFLGFDVTIRGRKNFPVMLTYRAGVLKVSSKTVA